MKISIMANEPIQGAPQFVVVCSNLTWGKAIRRKRRGEVCV